jgi:DNA (cytosine-5)-methyltransferase 1
MMPAMSSIELCAGAGGQALGLEQAGFTHRLLVDNDADCCRTLRMNRPGWNVLHADLRQVSVASYVGIDLLAGGLPCPPFSVAGKQLGEHDERNLFPDALRIIHETRPKFVLIENVRGFLDPAFDGYRSFLRRQFEHIGYNVDWRLLNARDYGVSQLRPRVAIVAAQAAYWPFFCFPDPLPQSPMSVGDLIGDLMAERGWPAATEWASKADGIAPTIVGGSKKHGGPDLGPSRARMAWERLGVNGRTVAEEAPAPDFAGMPRLTPRMVARIQGFPDDWNFHGRKTTAYRQIGNAFPPPVAKVLGLCIARAIHRAENELDMPLRIVAG